MSVFSKTEVASGRSAQPRWGRNVRAMFATLGAFFPRFTSRSHASADLVAIYERWAANARTTEAAAYWMTHADALREAFGIPPSGNASPIANSESRSSQRLPFAEERLPSA